MEGREGHIIEPRVFWFGLANGEVESITIQAFPSPALRELEQKAQALGSRLSSHHLENGFVVSRKPDNAPDETGDVAYPT